MFLGDCLEITEWLAADVLVTDPPYGMRYVGFGGTKSNPRRSDRGKVAGDKTSAVRDLALGEWGTKPAIVFGHWSVPRPVATKMRLIWDKSPTGFMGDVNMPWGSVEEEIYVLGTGFIGRRSGNVIRAKTLGSGDSNRPDHPTPKPIGLMEVLVAKTVGVVADPFAGSGATLIAARNLGRRSIGVELEERYCELIAKRLSQQAFDFGDIA